LPGPNGVRGTEVRGLVRARLIAFFRGVDEQDMLNGMDGSAARINITAEAARGADLNGLPTRLPTRRRGVMVVAQP